ncbi:CHAD domain-containing protein [Streptomyces nitrosporeus]|uniref:CHAD domain-containing protein n=1 Tax=Streptomyces nitrosporeus TaxID=28894 RepID=A0A5J6FEI6_9ACTN|nr:CYTH and CHAD domain-containing protein [Streptomyces nitrosporeus]QEU74513.1 CHAD domain-containing protein [Streptomyces nitrosporeus]GGY83673.1 CHAD domain-containing protein [Streptomyces nitrosporeus]
MADSKREIERKYEATPDTRLPDLTGVAGVAAVAPRGVFELDAVYYDTDDLRLAAGSLTLRRRTGGEDAGWHLKFPVRADTRDEIRAPLSDTLPPALASLVRSRVRGRPVAPAARVLSTRDVHHLLDGNGLLLAEVSIDEVLAERLTARGRGTTSTWTEIEVELADDGDPALLDAVGDRLCEAGVRPARSASKLARALAGTAPREEREQRPGTAAPRTAGDHVLAYLREQADALVTLDPAVRRDLPDSVHHMRVATRRLRSALRTYRAVLGRAATDPVREELKWLAAELGVDRDREVLDARLRSRIAELPGTLVLGPVRARLDLSSAARRAGARSRVLEALDSERHLALLESLEDLLADPPLRPRAAKAPGKVLPRAVLKEHARLAARVGHALELPPGPDRDTALHEARKTAKRVRYAAEAARPALGKPAKKVAARTKKVQKALGDHQDSVVARDALRTLAAQAHGAGESAFTWGLVYGHEEAAAGERERELPGVWARAAEPGLRAAQEH